MQAMDHERTQAGTEDRSDRRAYHIRSLMDQRSRQQGGSRGTTFLVKFGRDRERTRYRLDFEGGQHDSGRPIPLMENILYAQRLLTEYMMPQQAAPRLSAPVLHSVLVKAAALPGEYSGHGMQVRSEEQDDQIHGLTNSYPSARF